MTYTVVPASGTSPVIVSLDATPPVRTTAGQGGSADVFVLTSTAVAPINMPTTDFLPLIRLPSNSIVHKLEICLDTAPSTSLTGSIGLVFSDGFDGTPINYRSTYALTSAAPDIISQSCFFYQAAITSYVGLWTDVTFQNYTGNSVTDGFYVPSASTKPLWQALGAGGTGGLGKATAAVGTFAGSAYLSCATSSPTAGPADPFGFFDITWFETTTGVNTAAVNINLRVTYSNAAAS